MSRISAPGQLQQPADPDKGIFALLATATQHAGQHLLSTRPVPGPVATLELAGDDHAPQGPLGGVVGGLQARGSAET